MQQHIVDGATLFGTGLACYALKNALAWQPWSTYGMAGAAIVLMLLGLISVWQR